MSGHQVKPTPTLLGRSLLVAGDRNPTSACSDKKGHLLDCRTAVGQDVFRSQKRRLWD